MRPYPELLVPALLLALTAVLPGCASIPRPDAMARGFRSLDADEKNTYLALYPWLDSGERRKALTDPKGYSKDWVEADPARRAEQLRETAPDRITGLSITPDPGEPGKFRALLEYRRARPTDVSEDSTWSITPEGRATLSDGKVLSRCASDGAELTVNFLGHISRSRSLPPGPEPLELRLKRRDALRGAEAGTVYFELVARCADDTADVSCAADWKAESPGLEVSSCGKVTRRSAPRTGSERMQRHRVSATFRGKTFQTGFVFEEPDSPLH